MSGDGELRDRAKAGRLEVEEVWVLLNRERLLPLILPGVSLEDTGITCRQNWWLPKARVSKICG